MELSAKPLYSIVEASARWSRGIPEIINWAASGKLQIVACVRFAIADGAPLAGTFEVNGTDVLPFARLDGPAPGEVRIYRLGVSGTEDSVNWAFVSGGDGEHGIDITQHDLFITAEEMIRFGTKYNLGIIVKDRVVYRAPTADRHDWESMYRRLCKRIFDSGLPEHLQELAREMQEWFIMQSGDGDAPDISTIRKRLQPIWNDLREAE